MPPSLSRIAAALGFLALAACTTSDQGQIYTATPAAIVTEAEAQANCEAAVDEGVEQDDLEFLNCMRSQGFVRG